MRSDKAQPHFISAFFREAFVLLGGRIAERERGRFEITRVPSILKERDRLIGRADPVLDRYARVTFDKALIAGQPQAELLAPGHPLLDASVDLVLERFQPLLGQGAVLVDDADAGTAPRLLLYLEHAIRDGRAAKSGEPRVISQRLQFILLAEDGSATDAGAAPYLDYRPITADERARIADVPTAPFRVLDIGPRRHAFRSWLRRRMAAPHGMRKDGRGQGRYCAPNCSRVGASAAVMRAPGAAASRLHIRPLSRRT